MKADYKNWMPQGMINGFAAATAVCCVVFWLVNNVSLITAHTVRSVVSVALFVLLLMLLFMTVWMILMHRAFSYKGKRQMSKQIIDGVAEYVNIPDGGKGLDVGCGSGALTIACAKRNPNASFMGID